MNRYVRVTNVTRGTTIATRVRIAKGMWQTVFGLHLLPRLQAGEGLLLPGATTIDTTFMGYPIDLLFLDASSRVTRLVPNMVPWRMVLSGHGGRDCLELPGGALEGTGSEVGDQLVLAEIETR